MNPYDDSTLPGLLACQDGVLTRAQVLALGEEPHDIRRRLRRNEWQRVLPGVLVAHAGPVSWLERAWAGVLHFAPAALGGHAALQVETGGRWRHFDARADIEIVVPRDAHKSPLPGYRLTRDSDFDGRARLVGSPPRLLAEHAALQLASRCRTEADVVGLLTDAISCRVTDARRLRLTVAGYGRLRHGAWIRMVLDDLAGGVCSALEHRYVTEVERAHELPRGTRQFEIATAAGRQFRDVAYLEYGVVVELDGAAYHDSARQREADLDRDLDDVLAGRVAVRLGWGQVVRQPCRTAARLGALLTARGWSGQGRACGPGCAAS